MEVNADRAALVALLMQADGGFVSILMEVRDLQPTAGGQPNAGVEVELQDGAVAVIENGFSRGKSDELAVSGGG